VTTSKRSLGPLLTLLAVVLGAGALGAAYVRPPQVLVSLQGATLRLITAAGQRGRVFPVGVGRDTPLGRSPLGTLYTGPSPRDRDFYLPTRNEPAFHRNLPFLRLDRAQTQASGASEHPYGVHGPITPTLIWGTVSAGCVRMRPDDLRRLYTFAVRHPRLPFTFIRDLDRHGGQALEIDRVGRQARGCPEEAVGVRALRRLAIGRDLHDRVCGGVDHWYAFELKGGDRLAVRVQHAGELRVELYGIRAISTVASGRFGLDHDVPLARDNRGDRYLRIVAGVGRRVAPYTLAVTMIER
jgi:hypothetical protein